MEHMQGRDPALRVEKVTVIGAERVRKELVEDEFAPVNNATTFKEVLLEADKAVKRLRALGVYQNVDVICDEGSDPTLTRLRVRVEERNAFSFKAGTFVGSEEGTFVGSGELRSLFGGAEKLEANVSYGTKHKLSFSAAYKQPRFAKDTSSEVRVYQSKQNRRSTSHHDEKQTGLSVALYRGRGKVEHKFAYDLVQRTLQLQDTASPTLKEEKLAEESSVKSSLSYTLVRDARNDSLMPSRGYLFKYFTELAGLGGNVVFTKHELASQLHLPLVRGLSLSLSGAVGYMRPLFSDRTRISDRFFIGGPATMRGFVPRGLGVKDTSTGTHLGGDLYGIVSALVSAPIPSHLIPQLRARLQAFVSAGNLVATDPSESFSSTMRTLVQDYRLSAGVGLVALTPFGRIEFNYCRALRKFSTDDTTFWQFGVNVGL